MRSFVIVLALSACTAEPGRPGGGFDSGSDTDTGASDGGTTDADGDGFLRWDVAPTPEEADCDDTDALVTPATERLVPAGSFVLGDDQGEPDQRPARTVTLSAYCIDVVEVSNSRFADFLVSRAALGQANLDAQGRPLYDFDDDDDDIPERIIDNGDGGYGVAAGYEDHPVTEVWHWSAAAFCDALAQALPTEAQWEKAANGPAESTFPWGEAPPDCTLGNLRPGPEGVGPGGEQVPACVDDTTPVGSYPGAAGAYGTLDMAGNVAEWVHDWYQVDAYATARDTDPSGPDSGWSDNLPGGPGEARLTRGGSFATGDYALRTTHRYVEPADATSNGVGFRCVREL